jgi:hypothetical protein
MHYSHRLFLRVEMTAPLWTDERLNVVNLANQGNGAQGLFEQRRAAFDLRKNDSDRGG